MLINQMKLANLRSQMLHYVSRLASQGMQKSDGGNISIRYSTAEDDYILIKASCCDFEDMCEEDFVITDMEGNLLVGEKQPSKEVHLHSLIYRMRPEANAVVHCHSPWATGFAFGQDYLEMATYHASIKLGDYVPVFDTKSYIVDMENREKIEKVLQNNLNMKAFLLRGHGQVAFGADLRTAVNYAELIEETAQIAVIGKISR